MKKIKYFFSGLLAAALLNSCDVERFPEGNIETSLSLVSVADAKKWDANFYSDLRGRVYGVFTMASDIQADELNATAEYGNNYGGVHRWSQDFNADSYEIRDLYREYYRALKNVNYSIEKFPTLPVATPAEQTELNNYLGDAYLMRAYYFLNLTLRYAKAYNPSTAASDLGIPLVLSYNLTEQPARATVEASYQQILSDLAQAKTLLAGVQGTPGATRFSSDAASALEARTKLYMGDLAGARTAAEAVISGGKYTLYNTAEGLASLWKNDAGQETIFQLFANRAAERPVQNSAYFGYEPATNTYRSFYIPSQWVIDAYEASDLRKAVYFKQGSLLQLGNTYQVNVVNKYPGNPDLIQSGTENHNAPKIFRVAELYLISAEASVVSNPGSSLARLNELRVARGLAPLVGLTGTNLLNEIKAERRKELFLEGFRLDDLKRYGEGFTRREPQGQAFLSQGAEFTTKTVSATNEKFVWGIPARDILLNPNLVQNPGW